MKGLYHSDQQFNKQAIRSTKQTMKVSDREYPVLGVVTVNGHLIPLLNIRMMSNERERELARKGAVS